MVVSVRFMTGSITKKASLENSGSWVISTTCAAVYGPQSTSEGRIA